MGERLLFCGERFHADECCGGEKVVGCAGGSRSRGGGGSGSDDADADAPGAAASSSFSSDETGKAFR